MDKKPLKNHDLLIKISVNMDNITKELKEMNSQLGECVKNETKAAVERISLNKDLESLANIVKNHLSWHKDQSKRLISYTGISAGIISTIVTVILRIIGI